MTTIKASCSHCDAEVSLDPTEVLLTVVSNAPSLSRYGFVCPHCTQHVSKPADQTVIELLAGVNIGRVTTALPAEALEVKSGDRLTHDDLLDFALALESCDTLAAQVS